MQSINKYKVDLHTHSIISHDGGLTEQHYTKLIESKVLDFIAITDHNETRFARIMQQKLGDNIIVGEEIATTQGEIIGLHIKETIAKGMTPEETVKAIKQQDGLVYIPHPFEIFRKGMQLEALQRIINDIDIIEVFNGRGRWRGKNEQALEFANRNMFVAAASSDAHCWIGIGKTFSRVREVPTRKQFKKLLRDGELQKDYAPSLALLCPTVNRIKNKIIV